MSAVEELRVLNKQFNQLAGKEYEPGAPDWQERVQAWRTKYGIKET